MQPRKKRNVIKDKRLPVKTKPVRKRSHKLYGSSKLEDDFAREFLDKLGVNYVRQFEAADIKRFYDFYLTDSRILIEVDGDYYHSYGLVYENMSPMQKKNRRVDNAKDTWAKLHGFPLLRIWEHDIRENPGKVMEMLKDRLYISKEEKKIKEGKNSRHKNKLNNKI